ncbi:unnamed protein product, partial [Rotaria magnacalcarata]
VHVRYGAHVRYDAHVHYGVHVHDDDHDDFRDHIRVLLGTVGVGILQVSDYDLVDILSGIHDFRGAHVHHLRNGEESDLD